MRSILPVVVGILALLVQGGAQALGLGEMTVHSRLGERLDATIPLRADGNSSSIKLNLADGEVYRRIGVEPMLLSLTFTVSRNPAGELQARIASRDPLDDPSLVLIVEAKDGHSRVMRQYHPFEPEPLAAPTPIQTSPGAAPRSQSELTTTLPQAPAPLPPQAIAPPAPVNVSPTVQPPVAEQPKGKLSMANPASAQAGSPALAEDRSPEPANGPKVYGPVERDETLWRVATILRPDPGVSMDQMMLGLYRNNPQAFEGSIRKLGKGAMLKVPTREAFLDIDAAEATRQMNALLKRKPAAAMWTPTPPAAVTATRTPPQVMTPPAAVTDELAQTNPEPTVSELDEPEQTEPEQAEPEQALETSGADRESSLQPALEEVPAHAVEVKEAAEDAAINADLDAAGNASADNSGSVEELAETPASTTDDTPDDQANEINIVTTRPADESAAADPAAATETGPGSSSEGTSAVRDPLVESPPSRQEGKTGQAALGLGQHQEWLERILRWKLQIGSGLIALLLAVGFLVRTKPREEPASRHRRHRRSERSAKRSSAETPHSAQNRLPQTQTLTAAELAAGMQDSGPETDKSEGAEYLELPSFLSTHSAPAPAPTPEPEPDPEPDPIPPQDDDREQGAQPTTSFFATQLDADEDVGAGTSQPVQERQGPLSDDVLRFELDELPAKEAVLAPDAIAEKPEAGMVEVLRSQDDDVIPFSLQEEQAPLSSYSLPSEPPLPMAPATESESASAYELSESAPLELDDIDLALDMDLEAHPVSPGVEDAVQPSWPAPIATSATVDLPAKAGEVGYEQVEESEDAAIKLDLAQAYVEMGDLELARALLDEIVEQGGATQRKQARALLDQISV